MHIIIFHHLKKTNKTYHMNNITINISAPLVDDTVVDSIIPAIERAKQLNIA